MSLPKVLLVEDEESHRLVIGKALHGHCDLEMAKSFAEGISKLEKSRYSLFILDIMLGDGDGFDLCSRIRKIEKYSRTPVIFLSAKSEVSNKVLGFSLGADDYIVKPCDPSELRARVEAKLRWTRVESENSRVLRQGPFTFFLDMQRLDINREGKEASINLTPLEFKLLYYLASHKDHIISREQILDGVWGKSTNVLDRSVDTYVASLRRKMGDYKRCLRSVHGVGYKFSLDELAQKRAS